MDLFPTRHIESSQVFLGAQIWHTINDNGLFKHATRVIDDTICQVYGRRVFASVAGYLCVHPTSWN